ncbi:MAG: phosphoribosylformylglycinamidine cyclo-ligase [Candidatus Eisenbacteria bacterium]
MDYRKAGVDIDAVSDSMASVKEKIRATFGKEVLRDVGHFGGLYAAPGNDRLALVATSDGLGTKILLYAALGRHDRVGEDLVSHCINDVAVLGARPLFFLDYIAGASLPPEVLRPLLGGFADACGRHGVALIGGETAEMPGMYGPGTYDVAGFLVGVVEREKIVDGSAIAAGDVVLGFPSSGLHTNGYSLARKVLLEEAGLGLEEEAPELGETVGDALLRPHLCYREPMERLTAGGLATGFAHITGGGLVDNVPRILPEGRDAVIRRGSWKVPPIFPFIQERGDVTEEEMDRVFNMGIGLVATVRPERLGEARAALAGTAPEPLVIGGIAEGDGTVRYE